jgi:hypothetical protein
MIVTCGGTGDNNICGFITILARPFVAAFDILSTTLKWGLAD